jgi:hypothetical protein
MNSQTTSDSNGTKNNMTNTSTEDRVPHPDYTLSTATGSCYSYWYGAHCLVMNNTETMYYFFDEAPQPTIRAAQGRPGVTELVYDQFYLETIEFREYAPNRIVSLGAERAWLRDLARRRAWLAKELPW